METVTVGSDLPGYPEPRASSRLQFPTILGKGSLQGIAGGKGI
jgi:hypothetical protein